MENDENFDLDKLEAQLINNDDKFSETTSSYNGESFSKADKKPILHIDEFDSADDKDDESDDLGELVENDPERIQILLNQLIESLPLNYGEILAEGTVVSTKK
jgi:hypothetical protein